MSNATINVGTGTIVQEGFRASGKITMGENNVLQPHTAIYAEKGPIIIGDNNIFEDYVVIVNNSTEPMHIGNDNYFEASSNVDSSQIGNENHIEPRAKIMAGSIIKNQTVVSANCYTEPGSTLEDLHVIYGEDNVIRKQFSQNHLSYHHQHIKYLRKGYIAFKSSEKKVKQ